MKTVLAFCLGVILTAGVVWVMSNSETQRHVKDFSNGLGEKVNEAGQGLKDAVEDVDVDEAKRKIRDTGSQVADKTREVVSDASITAAIKAKLIASPDVSALSVDVDTTDGVVTLSGKLDSMDAVKEAVTIASTVDGVKQVLSTVQVESKPPAGGVRGESDR